MVKEFKGINRKTMSKQRRKLPLKLNITREEIESIYQEGVEAVMGPRKWRKGGIEGLEGAMGGEGLKYLSGVRVRGQ